MSYVNQEDDAVGISTWSQSGRKNNSIRNQTSNGSQASVTQAAADNVSVLTQGRSAGNAYQTNGQEALISQTGRRNQSYASQSGSSGDLNLSQSGNDNLSKIGRASCRERVCQYV